MSLRVLPMRKSQKKYTRGDDGSMGKAAVHRSLILCLAVCCLFFTSCSQNYSFVTENAKNGGETSVSMKRLPEYSDQPYIAIEGNEPGFTDKEKTTESFESYSKLDSLGRCGVAYANVGRDLMPTEKRGSIGKVRPSGWHTVKYDIVDGKYLYNRCHLIGYQLTSENANERNLITGTRYMNVEGMLPFENMVADYIKETGFHVLYRVTPVFEGENLLAEGVEMEAYSVEDEGEGVCFHVFVYNVQPGIEIDYETGDSRLKSNGE